jgi:murein DD-endopeptidase MepM/ murein hydrolase activator NlpD
MIKLVPPLRGSDAMGDGSFGASRGDRTHNGIDYAAAPGSTVLSPVWGFVSKLGYPYGDDLTYRYVEITNHSKRHRYFYVAPIDGMAAGDEIQTGEPLGTVQDIAKRYSPRKMKNHIHYEIIDLDGNYIDPEEYWNDS